MKIQVIPKKKCSARILILFKFYMHACLASEGKSFGLLGKAKHTRHLIQKKTSLYSFF